MKPESLEEYLELIRLLDSEDPRNAAGERVRRADYIHRLLYFDVVQAVRDAASFYLSEDRGERQAAAFVVQGALPHFSGQDILRFSSRTWWRSWRICGDWKRLSPSALRRFDIRPDRGLFQLATLHPNGYVRQAALEALAAKPLPSDWPFVLVRLTDWVAQVSGSAERMLAAMLVPENWEGLMRHGYLIASLANSQRLSAVRSLPLIVAFLQRDPRFVSRWAQMPVVFRRMAVNHLQIDDRLWEAMVRHLHRDGDLYVNRVAVSMAATAGDIQALRQFQRGPIPEIRVLALEALTMLLPDQAEEILVQALSDPSWPVRNAARFYLDHRGGMDYRSHYLGLLPSLGAVAGLGDVGTVEDARLLEPFLSSPAQRMRFLAVRGVARLDADRLASHGAALVKDSNRKIRELAIGVLGSNQEIVSIDERVALFRSADLIERKTGARLLFRIAHWDAGYWILAACGDEESQVRDAGIAALSKWIKKSYLWAAPTAEQRARLETVRHFCPSGLVVDLDRVLRFRG